MSKINVANLSYQITKGSFVSVEETTLTGLTLEYLGDSLFGVLCRLHGDWMYEVRWGPKDPDYGLADRSLGHLMFNLGQWCGNWGFRRRVLLDEIPVPFDSKLAKDAGWPFDGTELEDDE